MTEQRTVNATGKIKVNRRDITVALSPPMFMWVAEQAAFNELSISSYVASLIADEFRGWDVKIG